jgi:hypothetical protein
MTNPPSNEPGHQMDLDASASKEGLSLKAKGAGLFVLLALDILGIIVIGYQLTQKDSDFKGYLPLMFLLWIGYELIATLDATLGLKRVRHRE